MSDTPDRSPGETQAAQEQGDGAPGPLFDTTAVQATRTRMQGNGVGESEIAAQGDPDGARAAGDSAANQMGEGRDQGPSGENA